MAAQLLISMLKFSLPPHISSWVKTSQIKTNYKTFQLTKKSKIQKLLGKITILVLCRQSPLNLHQFRLTRDSKNGLVGTGLNAIWQYIASIWLYLSLLFIMSMAHLIPQASAANLLFSSSLISSDLEWGGLWRTFGMRSFQTKEDLWGELFVMRRI